MISFFFQNFWFRQDKDIEEILTNIESDMHKMTFENFSTSAGHEISKAKILKLLQPDTWLCDQVINFCLEGFKFRGTNLKDTFYFNELTSLSERLSSPKWNEIFQSASTLAIPVNLDKHWSLIVLRNKNDSLLIEFWDSLPTQQRNNKIIKLVLDSYNAYSAVRKNIAFAYKPDCYIQLDSDNCGIFLISNIISLILNKPTCNIQPEKARKAVALLIFQSIQPHNGFPLHDGFSRYGR